MIRFRFLESAAKRRGLGDLAGPFPVTSWATGEMLVPESVLGYLAVEGIPFMVEELATRAENRSSAKNGT
jgi:hypothetical protein